MEHYQKIKCPDCDGTKICKNDHSRNGSQRYLYQNKNCKTKSFQLEYSYNAHKRANRRTNHE